MGFDQFPMRYGSKLKTWGTTYTNYIGASGLVFVFLNQNGYVGVNPQSFGSETRRTMAACLGALPPNLWPFL